MNVAEQTPTTIKELGSASFLILFDDQKLEFQEAKLSFLDGVKTDVFGKKNNKTLAETLAHKRYAKFAGLITTKHPTSMNVPLGEFLLGLKKSGDVGYKSFLNEYGDGSYCTFRMERGALS